MFKLIRLNESAKLNPTICRKARPMDTDVNCHSLMYNNRHCNVYENCTTSTSTNTDIVTIGSQYDTFTDQPQDMNISDTKNVADSLDSKGESDPKGESDSKKSKDMKRNVKRSANRSIMSDLNSLQIPEHIKQIAQEQVYEKLEKLPTKRGEQRKYVIFYCIHIAYKLAGDICDIKSLASQIGIQASRISRAFTICSPIATGYQPPNIKYTPVDYVKLFFKHTKLHPDCISGAVKLTEEVLAKDKSLSDIPPQKVAISCLCLYMDINGVAYDFEEMTKLTGSSAIIKELKDKVSKVYNF